MNDVKVCVLCLNNLPSNGLQGLTTTMKTPVRKVCFWNQIPVLSTVEIAYSGIARDFADSVSKRYETFGSLGS